jgi:hypothetical protein
MPCSFASGIPICQWQEEEEDLKDEFAVNGRFFRVASNIQTTWIEAN